MSWLAPYFWSLLVFAPQPAAAAPSGPVALAAEAMPWRYDVHAGPGSRALVVTATFPGLARGTLSVMTAATPFVRGVQQATAKGFAPLPLRDGVWTLGPCPAAGCAVRYEFAMADAAAALGDPDVVGVQAGVYLGNVAAWLLHPDADDAGQAVQLHVVPAPGQAFATGLFPVSGSLETYITTADHLDDLPLALFGPLKVHELKKAGGTAQLAIGPGTTAVSEADIVAWADRAATAVTAYYRRFPVEHALVYIRVATRGGGGGVTFGYGGATIIVPLRARATTAELTDDWVLTHEMVHLALPSLPQQHHWLEEGLATYVEPIARIRAGYLTPARVFHDMIEGLPNGLPDRGDEGLDHTPTWGRTYWGGALFCFLADIDLRQRSHGKVGLEDALRGILAAGGSVATDWDIARVLAAGDGATGFPVLRQLYDRMKDKPTAEDLDAVWRQIGVAFTKGHMRFDDTAPLAYVRQAIVSGVAPR